MIALRPYLRCLSLGAGVQSTTLALMAAAGEVGPMPDCAVFADTQWEPREVYAHLERLTAALPFPVYRVSAGNIRENILAKQNATGQRFASVPWFTRNPDGSLGMGRRQCSKEYKILPIAAEHRRLLGYAKGERLPLHAVEVWIGISTDEASRMKPALYRWQDNRWPLIETRMSRTDCLAWLERAGWSAPKSSCIACPFHSNAQWRRLKENAPEEWAQAVAIDRAIRQPIRGMRGEQFAHASRVPLEDADLRSGDERAGQSLMFVNECEGVCGV